MYILTSSGILGLGAGTVARMLHAHYPNQMMAGWELDPAVLMAGRLYMGLDQLEASGKLVRSSVLGHAGNIP
jgi:spermidine synthase